MFAATLDDRRLDPADKPAWSLRQLAGTFYVNPRANPDFAWAFASRFLLVMAYAFLVTYQAYYLLEQLGSAEERRAAPDLPRHARPVRRPRRRLTARPAGCRTASGAARSSSWSRRSSTRVALVVIATATGVGGYLVGMAIGGLGFGMYMAVDLALVVDVLPDTGSAAKDLGVLNIAVHCRSPSRRARAGDPGRRR